jgi:hypothetical protein
VTESLDWPGRPTITSKLQNLHIVGRKGADVILHGKWFFAEDSSGTFENLAFTNGSVQIIALFGYILICSKPPSEQTILNHDSFELSYCGWQGRQRACASKAPDGTSSIAISGQDLSFG